MTEVTSFDYKEFDRIWDEKGQHAAYLTLPLEDGALVIETEAMDEKNRCIHCGELPVLIHYGPHRIQRSLWQTILRKRPMVIEGMVEGKFCDCWEPEGGYKGALDIR